MRRVGVWVLVVVGGLAGCGAEPAFRDVAGVLNEDGAALSRLTLAGKRVSAVEDRAGCPGGSRRGLYTITGDVPAGNASSAVVSALATELHTMGYQEAEGPGARFGVKVSVMRKDSLDITFTVALRADRPNVEITGQTGCMPAT
ncbi:hypothetical protein [Sphaerisporangium sp. TRM90804]|uniref:hypothetical protein n=1 Tax=Sphaerisporangium sp. TRM90804 TaxID=3031113 RepID=UPI00244B8BD1|nr:hypothetical protein [Sphaerisporangium sp. TRM90804]MDH2430134.1 hypothetical protein [Sphaerisporangium sp. TRM90804]